MQAVQGLVSITIPFHNSRRFLRETIESVLAQSYPHWELLLVDDGSSDGSADLARHYAASYPGKITCLEHPGHANLGVTRTRNLGARMSHGEFLAFLDSDDLWLPHKLQDQVTLLQAHPDVGMVCAPSEYWFDWDQDIAPGVKHANYVPEIAPSGCVYQAPTLLISTYPLGQWGAPCPSSLLIRRTAFDKVGGFVEEFNPKTRQLCEDTAFLTKIYLSDAHVMVSATCSDRYRRHPSSIWHRMQVTNQEELELKFYFQWLRRFLRERNCSNPVVWKAARRAGWMYWLPLPHSFTRFIRRMARKWRRWNQ